MRRLNAAVRPLLAAAFLCLGLTGPAEAQQDNKYIAVVASAPRGTVELARVDEGWSELRFGSLLNNGDRIRTGDDGFVALVFPDDGTQLKIRPNTQLELTGNWNPDASIAKRVNLELGELFTEVKQQKGSLQIATPTAVASVKGTEFWVIVGPDGTTTQITLEGLVDLLSLLTGQQIDVPAGSQGTIDPETGEIDLSTIPPDEVPQFLDEINIDNIQIRFLDVNGNEKTLIIQYRIDED